MKSSAAETIHLSFRCRNANCRSAVRVTQHELGAPTVHCPSCRSGHDLNTEDALVRHGKLTRCAVCGGSEFFVRKDFPQKLGMALVVLFGLVASIFYYYRNIPATFGTLAALVVVDAVIYFFVGIVTVCYRCRAEYRGLPPDTRYGGFDLATSEKYDVTT